MPTEPQAGADPAFTFPNLTDPKPTTPVPGASRPRKVAKPGGPAVPKAAEPRIQTAPAEAPLAPGPDQGWAGVLKEFLLPSSIKGWSWSIAAHGVLLVILGFWFFAPKRSEQKVFDSRLAGSPFGSELGVDATGGFDEALETPEGSLTVLDPAELTKVPPAQVALDPAAIVSATASPSASGAAGGGPGTTASGGGGSGFGLARFGSGGETIQGVAVKVGDPQFTLIWDTKADLDIHVLEPGGSEIYWEAPNGKQGGELDVDDIDGFGPENVYWKQGKGPPGEYKWFVQYYGGMGGFATPTRWKVRVKHDNKVTVFQGKLDAIGVRGRVYSLTVGPGGRSGRPDIPPADISGWKLFSSPEGAFTVSIPEIPAGQKQTARTPLGELDQFRYAIESGDGSYAVSYLDFPAAAMQGKDPLMLLDDAISGLIAAENGQQKELRRIALNGQPGREVQVERPDKGVTLARIFLAKNRLYQVSASGPPEFATAPEAYAFIRSFNFVAPK